MIARDAVTPKPDDLTDHKGCYCTGRQLANFLRVMGCDQKEGKFLVSGDIVSFLGMDEDFVIGPSACYYVAGMSIPLAANYSSVTGRGAAVVII